MKRINQSLAVFFLLSIWGIILAAVPAAAAAAEHISVRKIQPFKPCLASPFESFDLPAGVTYDLSGLVVLQNGIVAGPLCAAERSNRMRDEVLVIDPPVATPATICGGAPGTSLAGTVALLNGSTQAGLVQGAFDQNGCADLASLLPSSPAPLAPSALELATLSTRSGADLLTRFGLLATFIGFLSLTAGWVWMLQGKSKKSVPADLLE